MTRNDEALQVVVVEDEALIVMDLEHMIEATGHEMVASAPSVRGVKHWNTGLDVDVALVDLQLAGGSSGLEAADYIREVWPDALVVFVTANAKSLLPDIEKGHAVVPKPFTRPIVSATLRFLYQGIRTPPPEDAVPGGFLMNAGLKRRLRVA